MSSASFINFRASALRCSAVSRPCVLSSSPRTRAHLLFHKQKETAAKMMADWVRQAGALKCCTGGKQFIAVVSVYPPLKDSLPTWDKKVTGQARAGKMGSHSESENLFKNKNQAKSYANARPTYPASLFERLASLTERHELAWDVGTGNGQAASKIADHFKTVVATDISESQLTHAIKAPNVKYAQMSATPSATDLEKIVGPPGSVDLITVATALHWFDLDTFYPIVKKMLRKPGGVIAAWTYGHHFVNAEVDKVQFAWLETMRKFYSPQVSHSLNGYKKLPFPFEPAEKNGVRGIETLEVTTEMDFDGYIRLWESVSFVGVARENGEDVLSEDGKKRMLAAWGPRDQVRIVRFPCFLLLGTCSEARTDD